MENADCEKKGFIIVHPERTALSRAGPDSDRNYELCEKIDVLSKRIDDLTKLVREIETKIVEKSERDINRAIRRYAMQSQRGLGSDPIRFVANHSVPLSTLLRSKEL